MTAKSAISRSESNKARATHGHARKGAWTKVYRTWYSIRQRCNNPNTVGWKYYGGKGVRVCARWDSFEAFLADMGEPPTSKHSIDRIKNELGYSPENCKWATKLEQDNNRTSNVLITYGGRTQNVKQWSDELSIKYATLYRRLVTESWEPGRAFFTPVRKNK